jgi:hypothetical protein
MLQKKPIQSIPFQYWFAAIMRKALKVYKNATLIATITAVAIFLTAYLELEHRNDSVNASTGNNTVLVLYYYERKDNIQNNQERLHLRFNHRQPPKSLRQRAAHFFYERWRDRK